MPLKFNRIKGHFSCAFNKLKTLEGCPKYVEGDFDCADNWPHKIFENSNYTRMYITNDGKIECLGQSVYNYVDGKLIPVPVKFRKCTAKSKGDMVVRISKYVQDLQNCLIKPKY